MEQISVTMEAIDEKTAQMADLADSVQTLSSQLTQAGFGEGYTTISTGPCAAELSVFSSQCQTILNELNTAIHATANHVSAVGELFRLMDETQASTSMLVY